MTMRSAWIAILAHISYAKFPTFPQKHNETVHQLRYAEFCEKVSCVLDWIHGFQTGENESAEILTNCTGKDPIVAEFQLAKIRPEYVEWRYHYGNLAYCNQDCTVSSFFTFYYTNMRHGYEISIAQKEGYSCYPPSTKYYCKWYSRMFRFNLYFAFFAMPATVLINALNLATLSQMIGSHKNPAAALYLHRAEIYTDIIVNFFMVLHTNLQLSTNLDSWLVSCLFQVSQYVSFFQLCDAFGFFLYFLNQCTILNLVSDRLSAMTDPLGYNTFDGKKSAKKLMVKTIVWAVLLYFPAFVLYLTDPLQSFWSDNHKWWKANKQYMDRNLVLIYALPPLICVFIEVYRAFKYDRAYKRYQRSKADLRTSRKRLNELKQNEREKRLLLVGTLCLNVLTSTVNILLSLFTTISVQKAISDNRNSLWWVWLIVMVNPVLNFLNGTGSFLIHLLLLESYRRALKATIVGKLVSKMCGVEQRQDRREEEQRLRSPSVPQDDQVLLELRKRKSLDESFDDITHIVEPRMAVTVIFAE